MPERSTVTVFDSFGLDDQPTGEASATNESIKDRQAMRRLVDAGVLPPEQMPRTPRVLTPIVSPDTVPQHLRSAVGTALSMPSTADED